MPGNQKRQIIFRCINSAFLPLYCLKFSLANICKSYEENKTFPSFPFTVYTESLPTAIVFLWFYQQSHKQRNMVACRLKWIPCRGEVIIFSRRLLLYVWHLASQFRLSSACDVVHPTQTVEFFHNIFAPCFSLAISLGCEENTARK